MKFHKTKIEMIKSMVFVISGFSISITPKVEEFMLQYLKHGWEFTWILVAMFLGMRIGIFADEWDEEDRKKWN